MGCGRTEAEGSGSGFPPEEGKRCRGDEEVQEGGTDEAAHDDYGHRVEDLLARLPGCQHQGD
jgi:hypothetical protein